MQDTPGVAELHGVRKITHIWGQRNSVDSGGDTEVSFSFQ